MLHDLEFHQEFPAKVYSLHNILQVVLACSIRLLRSAEGPPNPPGGAKIKGL